jgi:hypothetical protein
MGRDGIVLVHLESTVAHAFLPPTVSASPIIAQFGEWLSLVEHLVRDQGVGGSNPLSPTILFSTTRKAYATFFASSFFSIFGTFFQAAKPDMTSDEKHGVFCFAVTITRVFMNS